MLLHIENRKGLGGWYDQAVAGGQYQPDDFTRVSVAIARGAFPDSEPTTIVTYSDGTREILMSGGPSSGALGVQAAMILGFAGAAVAGKLATEVVETVVDTAFQEATGSPVGPSALRSLGGDAPKSDDVTGARTPRKPSSQLRKEWEEAVGEPWPKDATTGHKHDVTHKRALADGGTNDLDNIQPLPHDVHIEQHKNAGDFKRWGARKGKEKRQ